LLTSPSSLRKFNAKSTKKKLFTQNSLLSETPIGTPVQSQSSQPYLGHQQKKTRTRTKIIKKGSLIIARQPSPPCANKENVYPNTATQSKTFARTPNAKKNTSNFEKPLTAVQNTQQTIVRNLRSSTSRRSSMDFITPRPRVKSSGRSKEAPVVFPPKELVLTSCLVEDSHMAKQVARKLPGKATVAFQVRPATTHVISGEERRTLNMLKAIIRGCWIVSKSWLLASLEAEGWVDEEPYELVTFSAAIKARRLEREADFLPSKFDLLMDIGSIYIGKNCKVPRKDLTDIIHLAGGHTVNQIKKANVILGHDYLEEFSENDDLVQVSEKWLLDSLQQYCPLPFVDYMIQN